MNKVRILIAIIISAAVLGCSYGLAILDPRNASWMYNGDSINHYIGWIFFRNEEWAFPIGQISSYLTPLGSTLTQMDAIPIMALVSKVFRSLLPQPFQYFGIWHYLCFFLQAYWGLRIGELLCKTWIQRIIVSCLFTMAPALIYRFDHHALCAHFGILIGIWAYLRGAFDKESNPPFVVFAVTNVVLAAVHPYLVAMTFPIFLITYLRAALDHPAQKKKYIFEVIFQVLSLGLACWALGYFVIKDVGDVGFGGMSADLLTFVNSMGNSILLPNLRKGWGQYEGFAYLGLGIILTLGVLLPWYFKNRKSMSDERARMSLLFWLVVAMFVFAMGTPLTFGGNPFFYLNWFYDRMGSLPGAFRSTGRFLWPTYYCIFVFTIWLVVKRVPRNRLTLVLFLVFTVQAIDLFPWMWRHTAHSNPSRLTDEHWKDFGSKRHMVLVPNRMNKGEFDCHRESFHFRDVHWLAVIAGHNGWSINSGFISRPGPEVFELCEKFWEQLPQYFEDDAALFVIHPSVKEQFMRTANGASLSCTVLDGLDVCEKKRGFQ